MRLPLNPREIDQDLVDAYLARRILDHLIGLKSLLSLRLFPRQNLLEESNHQHSKCARRRSRSSYSEKFWPFESTFDFNGTAFKANLNSILERNISKEPLKNELEVEQVEKN